MRNPTPERVYFTIELKPGTLALAEMSDASFCILRDGTALAGLSWGERDVNQAVIAYEKMRRHLRDHPSHALKKPATSA